MKVMELMSEDVVAVRPETSLKEVATILAERRISGVPVTDDRGDVIGVVSEADILVKERGPRFQQRRVLGWLLAGGIADDERLTAVTAGEAMTTPAIVIGATGHVSHAARLMTDHGIKRLPVTNWAGKLVGVITRSDLVRAFARSDAEIEQDVHEDMRRILWLDEPEAVEVRVEGGAVTLTGEVDRKFDADFLTRLVARVPGVVSVESTVSWRSDKRKVSGPVEALGRRSR
jgi:CBS domain-containing protein